VPSDVTVDEPTPAPTDRPLRDLDVRVKGAGCWSPLAFALVGAASGVALVTLCNVACSPPTWGSDQFDQLAVGFQRICLIVGAIIGGCIGLILGVLSSPRRCRPPRIK
jgi:hypothetical protein